MYGTRWSPGPTPLPCVRDGSLCGEDDLRLVCFSKPLEHWEVPARFDPRRLLALDCRLEYTYRFAALLVLAGVIAWSSKPRRSPFPSALR